MDQVDTLDHWDSLDFIGKKASCVHLCTVNNLILIGNNGIWELAFMISSLGDLCQNIMGNS